MKFEYVPVSSMRYNIICDDMTGTAKDRFIIWIIMPFDIIGLSIM